MKITHADVHFNHNGTPYASQFDDLYFSDAQGIEESQYVFLQHNQLPERWLNWPNSDFVIAETGFGTGLNLLVTLEQFAHLRQQGLLSQLHLHIISVEKFPLTLSDLTQALQQYPALAKFSQQLLEQYPPNIAGCHRLSFLNDAVTLDLWFGDVHEVLPNIQAGTEGIVDCWYLDGFAPSKNPDMWSEQLFSHMARLASADCSYATFTAAGLVKRGLQAAGFSVEKRPGHGKKRHNLCGKLLSKTPLHWPSPYYARPAPVLDKDIRQASIAIVGGGLAAAHCAYALARRGLKTQVYCSDAGLAQGASGNHQGALYPQLNAIANISSQFYAAAFSYATRFYRRFAASGAEFGHDWCGVLQLAFNPNVLERYQKLAQKALWPDELVHWLSAEQSAARANLELPYPGLYFPQGGWLNPPQLVGALFQAAHSELHTHHQLNRLSHAEGQWQLHFAHGQSHTADMVILATGSDFANLPELTGYPLQGVRGQVEYLDTQPPLSQLSTVLCHKGYLTPAFQGVHALGSTYVKNDHSREYRQAEQASNLQMQRSSLSNCQWAAQLTASGQGRAATRCSTPDRLPMVGAVANLAAQQQQYQDLYKALPMQRYPLAEDYPNLYMLNGLGSRGLTSAPLLAEVLASQICAQPQPLTQKLLDALNPNRFLIRALIRREI